MTRAYHDEVTFFNDEITAFLFWLQEEGLMENTIIILTSDHGEEIFDHGLFEHGHSMFNELIHVPLVISYPPTLRQSFAAVSPERLTSNTDILPTTLSLVGMAPTPRCDGLSLFIPSPSHRMLLSEQNLYGPPMLSAVTGSWHYILYDEGDPTKLLPYQTLVPFPFLDHAPQLFNLTEDPAETNDLLKVRKETTDRIRKRLGILRPDLSEQKSPSSEAVKMLKSVGYLE